MKIRIFLVCASMIANNVYSQTSDEAVGKIPAVHEQFIEGDRLRITHSTALRRSSYVNKYNVLEALPVGDVVTLEAKKAHWFQVKTANDVGWIEKSSVRKITSHAQYEEEWIAGIRQSYGNIQACSERLVGFNSTKTTHVMDIRQELDFTVVLLFRPEEQVAYQCESGAYGAEILRFSQFPRPEISTGFLFTPIPGEPPEQECITNQLLFDEFGQSIGWLSALNC